MNRGRRSLVVLSVSLAWSLGMVSGAAAEQFLPPLQAQNPTAVNGTTTAAIPKVAVVVGHSGSMLENIATGRADFIAGDLGAVPTTGCTGATCQCSGGTGTSTFGAAPYNWLPAYMQLYCRSSTATTPTDGSGPLLPDIQNVNVFDDSATAGADAGVRYQGYLATLFPDIDFTSSTGGSCLTNKCTVGGTSPEFMGTTYQLSSDDYRPDTAEVFQTTATPHDGVQDRSIYPWTLTPPAGFPDYNVGYNPSFYTPQPWAPTTYLSAGAQHFPAEPFVDARFGFTTAIRLKDPGATTTAWRNSKMRASLCAVEGFLGLQRNRGADPLGGNCAFDDLGDSAADDSSPADGYDDFFALNISGKADLAFFKTNQRAPGLYPPLVQTSDSPPTVDYSADRERVDLRVGNFYGPGATAPGGVSFGCNASGDEACDRSVALLMPDVFRKDLGGGLEDNFNDCEGLARTPILFQQGGYAFNSAVIAPNDPDFRTLFDAKNTLGYPGGVMSLSGILRDACGDSSSACPQPSSSLPDAITSSGIFDADTNACGSSNALVIITDSPDSCADISCATSVGDRLPGYPDSPGQPFPANVTASKTCPDNIAAAMRSSTSEAKTYIVGLDAGWDSSTKQAVAAVAAAGGTNSYYPAKSYTDVENALRAIYNDVKFSGDAVIPAGVFALGIARADSTNLKDVVIDARYKPQNWQGFLFAREITQSGQPLAFWEAGSLLAARDLTVAAQARSTFTTLDLNCDGKVAGADERVVFGVGNLDLTTAGGPYATQSGCTGAPRTSLKNVHTTGAPFFLDAQVDAGNGWTNRDGNAIGLIGYTLGMTPAQVGLLSGVVTPPAGYRPRDFDGNGTAGDSVWPLYDSVNSSPVIVGPSLSIQPNDADADGDGLTDFEEYQGRVLDRPRAAYIGTNGGSLHAFNVDGDSTIHVNGAAVNTAGAKAGGELFAMWPHELLNRLKRYANSAYGVADGAGNLRHEDGLDLTARIFDAKVMPNSEGGPLFGWRTVLVIGARNGGHVYMALDVTDPKEAMGLSDRDSTGALVDYTYPTLLWEFSEFKDDGHSATGDPLEPDARCDEDLDASPGTSDPTERSRFADCEDNGLDDNWQDRLGRSWSIPFVTRSRDTAGNPAMYVVSGPDTIEPGASPPGTAVSGAGYLLGIDVSSGSMIDLDSATSNGLPLKVSDSAISGGPNAGPVCIGGTGVSCTGGKLISPFRTSIAGGDITGSDDSTYSGQRADVLYWGDLGGRLWRGRFAGLTSNDVETKVLFFPGADTATVDTAHPIVSRPSMTPSKNQTLLGGSPPLLVVWGDGSLAFGPTDVAEGLYPVDEVGSDEKFRIFSVVDDAISGTAQYLDFGDETNCNDGASATSSASDGPSSNSGGDLDNRTPPSTTYPAVTNPQDPASGTHPPTTSGGYYQCLANNAGSGIAGATGSERLLGSPAILGGAVIVETMRPVSPITNVCYNVGTGSILAFDYSTAGVVNFTLRGGVTSNGGGKYYTAPENPVAVANNDGYKALGAPPDGFPPDFLRYHVITGGEAPAPQIPMETIYWREPF